MSLFCGLDGVNIDFALAIYHVRDMKSFADNPHPSKDIQGAQSHRLSNRRVTLCITGSVACIRSADIARALMRQGADVVPVMTEAASRLIHPDLMHWATGNSVVTQLTGAIEHVALAGNVAEKSDLVLVAPATANTIGKIACGIDDTPVTTTVTTALGEGIPVVIVPAMHEPMYDHPIVRENIEKLKSHGLEIVLPDIAEGKAKIADIDRITETVSEMIGTKRSEPLAGKRFLITAGRTVEYIDDIRCITNNSTGKMGMAIGEAALSGGAEVTIVFGKGNADPPKRANIIRVDTAEDMKQAVHLEVGTTKYDVCIATAAVGDWKPKDKAEGKITTHGVESISLELVPTPKIIDGLKELDPSLFLVAFRALSDLAEEELIENAYQRLKKAKADMIAVNDTSKSGVGFETDTNELFLIDSKREVKHIPLSSKREVGNILVESISAKLLSDG